jgi:hypothetical protein
MSLSIAGPAVVQSAERQARAVELRIKGHTYAAIGADLGITTAGAHKLVRKALELKRAQVGRLTEELRATDNARLEAAVKGLMPAVEQGNPRAVLSLVAVLARRAKLMGLDLTPAQVHLTATAGASSLVASMTDEELKEYARRAGLRIDGPDPAAAHQAVGQEADRG